MSAPRQHGIEDTSVTASAAYRFWGSIQRPAARQNRSLGFRQNRLSMALGRYASTVSIQSPYSLHRVSMALARYASSPNRGAMPQQNRVVLKMELCCLCGSIQV